MGSDNLAFVQKPLQTLGNLETSISGISGHTSPSAQVIRALPPQNPLKTRIPGPAGLDPQGQFGGSPTAPKIVGLPPHPGGWATEGSEHPTATHNGHGANDRLQQEVLALRQRVQQLETHNQELLGRLQQAQQTHNTSAVDEQVRRLYKALRDLNPSWSPVGLDVLEQKPASSLDPQRLVIIFDKAIQAVQNESSLINRVNEIHRKYGLSHYCISRWRDLNRQLKQNLERINSESVKVPVQTNTGNWVYVHKDSDHVVAQMEDYIKSWLKKINSLEQSPEFADLRTDLQ